MECNKEKGKEVTRKVKGGSEKEEGKKNIRKNSLTVTRRKTGKKKN